MIANEITAPEAPIVKETPTRTNQRRTFGPHHLRFINKNAINLRTRNPHPFWIAARLSRVSRIPSKEALRMKWNKESAKQIR